MNNYRQLTNLTQPLQQGGNDVPLRDQHPQLIRPDSQHSRYCLCEALVAALDEPVIRQKASTVSHHRPTGPSVSSSALIAAP